MIENHPALDIKSTMSKKLENKKIILGMTGSVAVVKSIEIARLLIRNGATVIPVMSEAATNLISPELVYWATGINPIVKLDGSIQHVHYAGDRATKADLFLIAPATANTIGKIANGIDDTTITTFATTAIGEKIPVVIVPAMHLPMYKHPIVNKNIEILKNIGVNFIEPEISEEKAKIREADYIVDYIIKKFNSKKKILSNKKILITSGRTVEYIDAIRVITNNSSGKMGVALADEALNLGADVTLISGRCNIDLPKKSKNIFTETSDEMFDKVMEQLKSCFYDYVICVAAVNDWKPDKIFDGKISTHTNNKITLSFAPTKKILDNIKKISPNSKLVAFRAIPENSTDKLVENAKARMNKADADFIIANNVLEKNSAFESDKNSVVMINRDGKLKKSALKYKDKIAEDIFNFILKN